jgi:O-antigen/teichoic acid export membrane protein
VIRSPLSRNTLILLISNVGSAVLSFALSVLIGRALGQDGLGVYSTALAWVFPLSLVAEFGLGTLITRDVAQNLDSEAEYLRVTTWARLWLGGSLIALLVVAAPLLSNDSAVVAGLQISAPLIIIVPYFGSFTAIFRARQVMWPIPWLNVGMLVIQVAMTIGVFLTGGGVIAAMIVNTVTSAAQLAAAWSVYRWKFVPNILPIVGVKRASPLHVTLLLKRAWPFALAAVLAALQTRIGTILLERLTDTGNVGYYAAATRFVEAGRTIPNALFGALFPALAALAQQPEAMRVTFRLVMGGVAGFGIVLGGVCTMLAPLLLNLTYGAKFVPAVPVLQIAMWSLLPSLLRGGLTLYWYALGREQFTNVVTGVMVVIQAAISLWFIPRYGASGVAMVSIIAESSGLALLAWPLFRRGRHART